LWHLLPAYLETRILPGIAAQNGIGWKTGRIRHIGLTGFDAGPVIIGGDGNTGISVDAIHVDYTPIGLLHKHITSISLSGLKLNVDGKPGRILPPLYSYIKP